MRTHRIRYKALFMGLALFFAVLLHSVFAANSLTEEDITLYHKSSFSRAVVHFPKAVDIRVVDGLSNADPFFFIDAYGAAADFDEKNFAARSNALKALRIQHYKSSGVIRFVFFPTRKGQFRVYDQASKYVYPIGTLQEKQFVPAMQKTDRLVIEVSQNASVALPALLSSKRKVILDPGHGGSDPGAVSGKGRGRLEEKDITLSIAKKVQAILSNNPKVEVHLTRNKDVYMSLHKRLEFAEKIGSDRDLFVSIHMNAARYHRKGSKVARGIEFYYLSRTSNPDTRGITEAENREDETKLDPELSRQWDIIMKQLVQEFLEEHQDAGIRACGSFQRRFLQDAYYQKYNRGIKKAAFRVLMNRVMPAILIEAGFIDHNVERKYLANSEFQDRLARLIANSILDYFAEEDQKNN